MRNYKKAAWTPPGVTTEFSAEGLTNLINPLSSLYKQTPDYVPNWWLQAFKGPSGDIQSQTRGSKVAHVLAKVIAGGATFAGAAWLLRAFMHSLDIDNVQDIKTSARASGKLDTVKSRPIGPALVGGVMQTKPQENKEEQNAMQKTEGLGYDMAKGSLPIAAAVAAMLASFKLADKSFDSSLGKRLDNELAAARTQSQNLALQRILRNRGLEPAQPQAVQSVEQEQAEKSKKTKKVASLKKGAEANVLPGGIQSSLGLLAAAVIAMGLASGFYYQHATSPNLAEYKAYKKGLQTYNKQRVLNEPIQSTPLDPQLLDYLDSNLAQAKKQTPLAPTQTPLKDILV